jgi:hypothetical protein
MLRVRNQNETLRKREHILSATDEQYKSISRMATIAVVKKTGGNRKKQHTMDVGNACTGTFTVSD